MKYLQNMKFNLVRQAKLVMYPPHRWMHGECVHYSSLSLLYFEPLDYIQCWSLSKSCTGCVIVQAVTKFTDPRHCYSWDSTKVSLVMIHVSVTAITCCTDIPAIATHYDIVKTEYNRLILSADIVTHGDHDHFEH